MKFLILSVLLSACAMKSPTKIENYRTKTKNLKALIENNADVDLIALKAEKLAELGTEISTLTSNQLPQCKNSTTKNNILAKLEEHDKEECRATNNLVRIPNMILNKTKKDDRAIVGKKEVEDLEKLLDQTDDVELDLMLL